MSKENTAPRQAETELEAIRKDIAALRSAFAEMAQLVMPHAMRNSFCECGRISCKTVTVVKPGASDAERIKLCDECSLPAGYTFVGVMELGPSDRETVAIANRLGCFRKS